MHRNPKQIAAASCRSSTPTTSSSAKLNRRPTTSGDEVRLRIFVSHYSARSLDGCQVRVGTARARARAGASSSASCRGDAVRPRRTRSRFTRPAGRSGGLRSGSCFRLLTADGVEVISDNYHELWFFPPRQRAVARDAPLLARHEPRELRANWAIAVAASPPMRRSSSRAPQPTSFASMCLAGGKLLWLAETKRSRRTYLTGIGTQGARGRGVGGQLGERAAVDRPRPGVPQPAGRRPGGLHVLRHHARARAEELPDLRVR